MRAPRAFIISGNGEMYPCHAPPPPAELSKIYIYMCVYGNIKGDSRVRRKEERLVCRIGYGRKIINVWRTSRRVEWLVYGVSYDICPRWYLDAVERYGVPWRFD